MSEIMTYIVLDGLFSVIKIGGMFTLAILGSLAWQAVCDSY